MFLIPVTCEQQDGLCDLLQMSWHDVETKANLLINQSFYMYSKYWQIIKDDSKRTFEVCGQATSENAFSNKTYAMQKAGMNVSCVIPPVTNKTSSKTLIKIVGYTKEDGLLERLLNEYREKTMNFPDE